MFGCRSLCTEPALSGKSIKEVKNVLKGIFCMRRMRCGKLPSVYIRIVYYMKTMCMYILKLIMTYHILQYALYIHTVERQSCNYSPSGLVVMFTLYLKYESPTVHVS